MKKFIVTVFVLVLALALGCSVMAADEGTSFNAGGVIIMGETEDALFISVDNSNDAVLAQREPWLSIPVSFSDVESVIVLVDGRAYAGEYVSSSLSVRFRVSHGGVYIVAINQEPVSSTAPGCTEDGSIVYIYNGVEYTEVVPATGHDFSSNGPTCDNCDERNPDYIYVDVVSPTPEPDPEPSPEPDPEPETEFSDVDEEDWFYDEVKYIVEQGLMNGVGDERFAPYEEADRAMVVTILWRLAGSPEVQGDSFSDVPDGQWYSEAVRWAASVGITNGYGDGRFGIDDSITREQLAVMLHRYDKLMGGESAEAQLSFADADKVSIWAWEACAWCYERGIMTGKPGNILDPQGTANRAELAVMLYRYISE